MGLRAVIRLRTVAVRLGGQPSTGPRGVDAQSKARDSLAISLSPGKVSSRAVRWSVDEAIIDSHTRRGLHDVRRETGVEEEQLLFHQVGQVPADGRRVHDDLMGALLGGEKDARLCFPPERR
jgi:hypothetical protein